MLAVAAGLCVVAPPAWAQLSVGEGGAQLYPAIVSAGGVSSVGDHTLITAMGQPLVVGVRQLGAVELNVGWLRPDGGRLAARDVVINDVRIEAVGPDMALVYIDAEGHTSGEVRFGQDV